MDFSGGCAIITGAGSDVGIAIATSFAQQSCKHLLLGDTLDKSENVEQACRKVTSTSPDIKIQSRIFDPSSESEVANFFADATQLFQGRIDFVVNVVAPPARTTEHKSVEAATEEFDQSYRLIQKAAFLIERCSLRHLVQNPLSENNIRGSIVHIVPYGTPLAFCLGPSQDPIVVATSNAIIGMCKTDAHDYAGDGIRVNCVAAADILLPERRDPKQTYPLGRSGTPEDAAHVVSFLSSPNASWLTGLVIPVDGGRSLSGFWPNQV